ncbi:MAG: hypothetical protein M3Q36_04230 [bacterium]|nr:hypothetical protein [bacterium]
MSSENKFGVPCPENSCPLGRTPDTHCHLPEQFSDQPNPNLEITDVEAISVINEILGNKILGIVGSYDGLTSHQKEDLQLEKELAAFMIDNTVNSELICQ